MPDLIPVFIPLAILILGGFILGRFLTIDLKTVGALAIYCFTPIVGFGGAAQLDITPSILLLPIITFILASMVGMFLFILGHKILADKSLAYLLPVATGSGNTGYFGLPLAIALFGSDVTGIYLLGNLGVVVFESTIGYYFINRGVLTPKQAILRVIKLPLLYALALGLLIAAFSIDLPAPALKLWELSKGAYVCVGMMIVGIALGQQRTFSISLPLLGLGILGKFLIWPLLAFTFVYFDTEMMDWLTPIMRQCILLISLAPMAANLAAYAAQNNMKVDQAAGLILITTLIAVIGLPFIIPLMLGV
jgi:malate permease and related proteins